MCRILAHHRKIPILVLIAKRWPAVYASTSTMASSNRQFSSLYRISSIECRLESLYTRRRCIAAPLRRRYASRLCRRFFRKSDRSQKCAHEAISDVESRSCETVLRPRHYSITRWLDRSYSEDLHRFNAQTIRYARRKSSADALMS